MHLTPQQVSDFHRDGYAFPFRVLSREQAAHYRQCLETHEAIAGKPLQGNWRHKTHLLFTWADELVHNPDIVDAVSDVLGPDLLCWTTNFFIKEPRNPGFVSWHQDSTYWGLDPDDVVTAWVALTPSTVESGCMRIVPGSHLKDQLPHRDTFAEQNMLTRGQEVQVEVKESQAVDVVLAQGEMSLHHVRLIHGSEPNNGAHRRIGFAIRYLPTYIRQLSGIPDSATLVRGKDEFGNFTHEPRPARDFDPEAVSFHAKIYQAQMDILYAGAAVRPDREASPAR